MDGSKAPAGKQFFAGNARQSFFEKSQEGDFAIAARRKVRGTAFGRCGAMAATIPIQHRFSKPGAGGDHGNVFLRVVHSAVEVVQVVRIEFLQAPRGGDQVVHQYNVFTRQTEAGGEGRGIQGPWNVRGVQAAVYHRAWDAETCGGNHEL